MKYKTLGSASSFARRASSVAHWIWGGGWLADMGVMDFAGGLVVHATAGTSALVVVKLLGNRKDFPTHLRPPHSPGLTMMGAAMLWVGWFGFNAGSALSAGSSAGMAMTVTHISAATASLVWVVIVAFLAKFELFGGAYARWAIGG